MEVLGFEKTKRLLIKYKIPFSRTFLVKSEKEVLSFAKKIGYPLVLKISASKILHKTESNGVKTEIKDEKELKKSFNKLIKIKNNEGILVQKMEFGKEIALGMKKDPQFGPVIMAGLGGIFIEILKDVSFRICPVSEKEAKEMLKELKAYPVLEGYRGEKGINIKELAGIITKLSQLSLKEKNIKEIDLNPVIVNQKEAKVVDAKFVI